MYFKFIFILIFFFSCNNPDKNSDKQKVNEELTIKKASVETLFNSAAFMYDSIIKDYQSGFSNEALKEKYKIKRDSIGQKVDSVLNGAYQLFVKNHLEKKEYDKFIQSLDNKAVSTKAARAKSLGITF